MSEVFDSHHGPCPWPIDTDCCKALNECSDPVLVERLVGIATEILWRASGRRYGICERTVRPCRADCQSSTYSDGSWSAGLWRPYLLGGAWYNCRSACGSCGTCRCCTAGPAEVPLPGTVQSIVEVRIDGDVVPANTYRVDDHRLLVRQDGQDWPACQDMSLPAGVPGTWEVTYRYGLPVGPAGQYALGLYVCELYSLCTGGKCRLPAQVEGLFRQGVNIDFTDDNLDLLSKGRTGLPEVDAWLASVNPYAIHEAARVYSVDVPRARTRTWGT